jgi:hypothetical protein
MECHGTTTTPSTQSSFFCQTSPRCNGKFTEESLIEYLILASALETCEFNKVSALDFLLSKKDSIGRSASDGGAEVNRPICRHMMPAEN